ncbi:hypothetical protein KKA87_16210 [bacterium]|nr:hypothetical protein [bacterium]
MVNLNEDKKKKIGAEQVIFTSLAAAATGSIVAGPVGAIVGAVAVTTGSTIAYYWSEHKRKEPKKHEEGNENG